jgi:hypothetical protein
MSAGEGPVRLHSLEEVTQGFFASPRRLRVDPSRDKLLSPRTIVGSSLAVCIAASE